MFSPLVVPRVNGIENCAPHASIKLFSDDTNAFLHGKSIEDTINKANDTYHVSVLGFVLIS